MSAQTNRGAEPDDRTTDLDLAWRRVFDDGRFTNHLTDTEDEALHSLCKREVEELHEQWVSENAWTDYEEFLVIEMACMFEAGIHFERQRS
jgi:hypothetical protein